MRDNCVSTTNTGKARSLAKASEFNCASAGARNFINGVRQIFIADVAVVCSIEQNKCTRFVRVIHKFLQRFAAQNRTRRVVRAAKVNQLHRILRQVRLKVVLSSRCKICHFGEMSIRLKRSRATRHHVAIKVNRINGVRNCNFRIGSKEFLDVRDIAFRTITYKHVVRIHFDSARSVFATDNGFTQEIVTLFGTVTTESPLDAHFVHGLVHGLNNRGDKRRSDIANAQADDVGIFMGALVFLDFLCNGRKKVTARKTIVVRIDD